MTAHPADVTNILRQAAILVGKAEALGVTLRITGSPLQPLAMGNQRHVIDAWTARILPTARQGAATPEHHERMAQIRRAQHNASSGMTSVFIPGVGYTYANGRKL